MVAKKRGHSVDEIYRAMVDRIINGVYLPGRKLSQSELADELDVSRTPLREALNRLQQSGLVVATTNRGMEVSPVTLEETAQLYAMRLLIEPPVVAAITEQLTEVDLQNMADALERMSEGAERTREFQDAHHQFHEAVLVHYPAVLREIIESIYLKINRHQRIYFSRPRAPEEFCAVDRLLLDASMARNGELAKHILEFHLIDAALGLVRDADTGFEPVALIMAARGLGIHINFGTESQVHWPARISWVNGAATQMPAFETSNLIYEPEKSGSVALFGST